MTSTKNIVVLISGRGSNFKAMYEVACAEQWVQKIGARFSAVISNRPDAGGLSFAQEVGLPTRVVDHKAYESREDFEKELIRVCDEFHPDLIVLAGFMRVLTPYFVNHYEGKILNIHPALLPMFPGLHTHERALEAGIRIHGVTVHFVSSVLDGGSIIGQAAVPVLAGDDPDTLASRVLKQEHILYPRAVKLVIQGKVKLQDGKTVMDFDASKELAIF
ncbi:MAG: phosphoribosylglycinamide formyltransferase [Burkholderiaceae bacterium]|nr:phosphoribosylglycinamide formyltransferase [Burkholderiaceae bacterium]